MGPYFIVCFMVINCLPQYALSLYLLKVIPPAVFAVPSPTAISRSAAGRRKQPSPVARSDARFLPAKLGLVAGTPGPLGSVQVLGSIAPFASTVRICRDVAQSLLVRLQIESNPEGRSSMFLRNVVTRLILHVVTIHNYSL